MIYQNVADPGEQNDFDKVLVEAKETGSCASCEKSLAQAGF